MEERIIYLLDKAIETEKELKQTKDDLRLARTMSDLYCEQKEKLEEENTKLHNSITILELKIKDLENKETQVFENEEV